MGIDIYAKWAGITKAQEELQITGFDPTMGRVGYLREAYHGEPYATHVLVSEAFRSKSAEAKIPAAKLRKRLPRVLKIVAKRQRTLYKATDPEVEEVQQSFTAFVELCERKERETGEPCLIIASY